MATSIQVKRGATANVAAYTPLIGELALDTTTYKLYVGDGSTAGGKQIVASRKGITDASSAATGEIGEVLTATTSSTAVTTATALNATSLVLTPGDWDVCGVIRFDTTTAALTSLIGGLNTTSATQPSFPNCYQLMSTLNTATQQFAVPTQRINVSTNTTIYLVAYTNFTSGTVTVNGYIRARRAR